MKPLIRRAAERGHFQNRWLDTRYTFSFADYHDDAWMGFRTLRVINEDRIAPGKGFDLHGHRDMEIITYVMQGSLRHVDTMGNNDVLRAGEVQVMTAGAGVQHMELNASQTEECHLYQIWIQPNAIGLEPSYTQKSFKVPPLNHPGEGRGPDINKNTNKILIASPDAREGSLKINQSAEIFLQRLQEGETTKIEVPDGKAAWLQLISGELSLLSSRAERSSAEGSILRISDALAIDESMEFKANAATEFMLFIL
jgi:redox-sensitive bicupin YhaK (pirin superfamily)